MIELSYFTCIFHVLRLFFVCLLLLLGSSICVKDKVKYKGHKKKKKKKNLGRLIGIGTSIDSDLPGQYGVQSEYPLVISSALEVRQTEWKDSSGM